MELVYITSACTIISAIITILNFSKEGKSFSRFLSAVLTIGFLSVVIFLVIKNKQQIQTAAGDLLKNENDSLAINEKYVIQDSIDKIIELKFDAAKSITNSVEKCEELAKIVHFSVRQTKFVNAIKICEEINISADQVSNLEFVSRVALACKDYDTSIKAASIIQNSSSKNDMLGKIVDYCLLRNKHQYAIKAANEITNSANKNEYLKKILQK